MIRIFIFFVCIKVWVKTGKKYFKNPYLKSKIKFDNKSLSYIKGNYKSVWFFIFNPAVINWKEQQYPYFVKNKLLY